jgi:4'-phosphopantetheinyl transferase
VEPLGEGEVRVWLAVPEAVEDLRLLASYEALLSPEERDRAARFRFERHRRRFVVTHALVRESLSRCAPVAREAWSFRAGKRGKPEVAGPASGLGLRFNLSHTDGLAACAVARSCDVGVDVEAGARVRRHLEVAERFFSPREVAALRALPAPEREGRFLDTWTLKEAYLKARGLGLAIPLDAFTFLVDGPRPRLELERDLRDDPAVWQFELLRPAPEHRLALALRRGPRPDLRVRVLRS